MSTSQNSRNRPFRNGASKPLEDAANAGFRNPVSLRNLAQAQTTLAVTLDRITVNAQRRTTDLPSFQPCSPHACLDPFHNRLPLDLSYRANDYHHGPAKRSPSVDVFSQADELDAKMIEFVEHFQKMANVPCHSVKGSDKHNIEASSSSVG